MHHKFISMVVAICLLCSIMPVAPVFAADSSDETVSTETTVAAVTETTLETSSETTAAVETTAVLTTETTAAQEETTAVPATETTASAIQETTAAIPAETVTEPTSEPTAAAPVVQAVDPWVTTGLADYPSGGTVTLSGGGWSGDVEVILVIDDISSPIQPWQLVDAVPVEADGSIHYSFTLPDWFVAQYQVRATGNLTGRMAVTTFTDTSIDFSQLKNEPEQGWINGDLNTIKSTYVEGMSVPQRLVMEGINPSVTHHFVTFEHQFTKSDKYAYDFITGWDNSVDAAARIGGQTWPDSWIWLGVNNASAFTYHVTAAIPGNTNATSQETAYEGALGYTDRVIDVYASEPISNVTISMDPTLYASSGETALRFSVVWDGTATKVMIIFGAHIAVGLDPIPVTGVGWGPGMGASAIPGSPYHTELAFPSTEWTGICTRANQLKAGAVLAKSGITGMKFLDVNGNGSKDNGDMGLAGWVIWLDLNRNGVQDITDPMAITAPDGSYSMYFYLPTQSTTTLRVYEVHQPGFTQTYPSTGYNEVILNPGFAVSDVDFGNTIIKGALQVTKSIVLGNVVGTPVIPDFSITITGLSYPLGNTKVFNTVNGLTQTWTDLLPGPYTITESSSGASWTQTVPAGAVTVAAGQTATTGVTNTYVPGALQVTKSIVLGDVVGTPVIPDFSITITGPSYLSGNTKVFNTVNGLTQTWTNLLPGAYTITESSSGASWSQTVPAGPVTVAAGQTATAGVTNTYVPGALQVTKSIVLGDVVGTPVIPDFSITITGPSYLSGSTKVFNTVNGLTQTWTNLLPGAYTITESSSGASWSQTVPTGPVTVTAGQTATAGVTNTYVPGALQVTKQIELGGVVGLQNIPDFSITITGPSYPQGSTKVFNALLGLTQTWSNLIPGPYTITESSTGIMWTQTVPAMAITVSAGQTATAVVTNSYVTGSLQVTKHIELGNVVGTPVIPDFSITVTGPSYPTGDTKLFNTVNGLTQTWSNLIPGPYTITETASGAMWTQTVPAGAVTVAAGQTAAAGVTNTYVPGALEVTKSIVLGDVAGLLQIPDFSITITGPSYPGGDTKVFNTANGLTQTWSNLIPGPYTITEAASGAMWTQAVPAGAVTVAAGQTATAGVTNTYVPGALEVTKSIVLGDVAGLLQIPDFSITITGPSYPGGNTKFFNVLLGLTQTWTNLIPGDYTITEAVSGAMWTQTVPAIALTVAAGQTASASVTNEYLPGALQVTKSIVLGTVAGTPAIPDFSITITGPSYPTGDTKVFNTVNGLTQTWSNLIPGAYTITEAAAGALWTQTVPAEAVTVATGATATAGVTNTYVPGALQVTKVINLVDVTGTPTIPDFSITITGPSYPTGNTKVFNTVNGLTQTWTNLIPGAYTITEASIVSWNAVVPAGPETVTAGATATATVTNTLTGVLGAVRTPTPIPTPVPTAVLGAAKTGETDQLIQLGLALLLAGAVLAILGSRLHKLGRRTSNYPQVRRINRPKSH